MRASVADRLGLTHMCAFSRIPHNVHRPPVSRLTDGRLLVCLALFAWYCLTWLGADAALLAFYVLDNRCDFWLIALPCDSTWYAVHLIGGYACRMLSSRFGLHLGSLLWLTI